MSHTLLINALETVGEHPEKVNHWIIGACALVILFGAMAALLFFGGGRDHT